MKLYKKIILILLPLAFAVSSCDDQLNLSPKSLIGSNSYWNSQEDVQGAIMGMYVRFRGETNRNLSYWGDARSELLTYGGAASENLENYFENTLNATSYPGPTWKGLYTVMHDCNLLLQEIPNIEFESDAVRNEALAQVYTMRAYLYFVMVRVWGGVPIVTEPTIGFDAESSFKARNTSTEVTAQIAADISEAEKLFPTNLFLNGRSVWSKPALNAFKGNFYLWKAKVMGGGDADLNTALTALQAVQLADVSLLDDYDKIFRYDNKQNDEILMSMHYEDLESSSMYNAWIFETYGGDAIVGGDPVSVAIHGTGGGINRWGPAPLFRNQFEDDDSRKLATFIHIKTADENGDYTVHYASVLRKFRGFVEDGSRKFLDDVVLYRYADVLLMIAEAKNALGQDPTGEMNQVRQRAFGDNFEGHEFVNGTKAENNDAILKERLLELGFECKRWFDLLRFDKAFEIVPSLQGRDAYLKLFPISSVTISQNSKIEQNPGY